MSKTANDYLTPVLAQDAL